MQQNEKENAATTRERITRDCLRAMRDGESITVTCRDGYDMESQKNTAYSMGKIENCRFSCRSVGLRLTVTKYGKS